MKKENFPLNSKAVTFWFTGLPCAGKTTLARRTKEELQKRGLNIVHLDGDDIRQGISEGLGFSREDRIENLRRAAHVAGLFNKNNIFVAASFISPTNEMREIIRSIIKDFKLIYVKCSVKTCEKRDLKGMYKRARLGEITNFTGVQAPYEEPEDADLVLDTENKSLEECINEIFQIAPTLIQEKL